MLATTYIDAVSHVAALLEGNAFGLIEMIPCEGHAMAYGVQIEAGPSWVIYQPKGVSYWAVVDDEEYETRRLANES